MIRFLFGILKFPRIVMDSISYGVCDLQRKIIVHFYFIHN